LIFMESNQEDTQRISIKGLCCQSMDDSIAKSVGSEQAEGACPETGQHPKLNVLMAKENFSTKSTKDIK